MQLQLPMFPRSSREGVELGLQGKLDAGISKAGAYQNADVSNTLHKRKDCATGVSSVNTLTASNLCEQSISFSKTIL